MTLTDASHVRNTGPLEQQTIAETLLQDERAPASALPTITMAEGRTHLDLSLDAAIMIDALAACRRERSRDLASCSASAHVTHGTRRGKERNMVTGRTRSVIMR